MQRRTWRIDFKPDGSRTSGVLSHESGHQPSRAEHINLGKAGVPAASVGTATHPLRRCRDQIMRITRKAWFRPTSKTPDQFEEALHRVTAELAKAGSSDSVEAALLRFAAEIAPDCRFELARGRATSSTETATEQQGNPKHTVNDQSPRTEVHLEEIPLVYGAANHGRLIAFSTNPGESPLQPKVMRRLQTATTMAACAIENLRRNAEWSWNSRDESSEGGRPRVALAHCATVARDATFLNAVLPFALSQAERHREPVSLLCLAIDRLAAIQDLLGTEVADRLVQNVTRKVSSLVRSSDIVVRLDDDRIVIVLMRARGPSGLAVARIIGRAMSESYKNLEDLPPTTVSIGLAEFPTNAHSPDALLDASDNALAQAQRQGPNHIVQAQGTPHITVSSDSSTADWPALCSC